MFSGRHMECSEKAQSREKGQLLSLTSVNKVIIVLGQNICKLKRHSGG